MAEETNGTIELGQFERVTELLSSSYEMQIAFISLVIGLAILFIVYKKFSNWIGSKKIDYTRPHLSRFVKTVLLPVFAIVLVSSISAHVQFFVLVSDTDDTGLGKKINEDAKNIFAKILATINIFVVGFTVSRLIPIILNKRAKSRLEQEDFDSWMDMRGFEDDQNGFFHKLFEWIPPKKTPKEMDEQDFQKMLQTKEGRETLEQYRTSKGQSIGTFKPLVEKPFEEWKESEREREI